MAMPKLPPLIPVALLFFSRFAPCKVGSDIVHEELVKLMGGDVSELVFAKSGPTVILLAGLQGVGKTTLCAKLAFYLKEEPNFSGSEDCPLISKEYRMDTIASGMPSVEDGTKRFMELLDNIRNGEHKLPNSMIYLFVPGLFSNHGPLYFVNTKMCFSRMGLACHIAKIHSQLFFLFVISCIFILIIFVISSLNIQASVEKNAREIKEYLEEIYWGSRKRVLLLGHSKGVDAAAALSMYWTDLKDKVAGLALAQSPYGGSPIASDIL